MDPRERLWPHEAQGEDLSDVSGGLRPFPRRLRAHWPGAFDQKAKASGRLAQNVPVSRSVFFVVVIQSSLDTGTKSLVGACPARLAYSGRRVALRGRLRRDSSVFGAGPAGSTSVLPLIWGFRPGKSTGSTGRTRSQAGVRQAKARRIQIGRMSQVL